MSELTTYRGDTIPDIDVSRELRRRQARPARFESVAERQEVSPDTGHLSDRSSSIRSILQEDIARLTALRGQLPLLREDTAKHQEKILQFKRLLQDTERMVLGFDLSAKGKKTLGPLLPSIHHELRVLHAFLSQEEALSEHIANVQEAGGKMKIKDIARLPQTEARMQADPQLIPAYLQLNRTLATAKRITEKYLTELKGRLGNLLPEEAQQLAQDPSDLSLMRRGWEWLRHTFDPTFKTTTDLLAHYRTSNENVALLTRQQQEAQRFIEEGRRTESPEEQKTLRELSPALDRMGEVLHQLNTQELKDVKDIDRLMLYTQQTEEQLAKERNHLPYQVLASSEKTLATAKHTIAELKEQTLAQVKHRKSDGSEPNDLVAREIVLFGTPRMTLERKQYEQLYPLLDLNPNLRKAAHTLYQDIQQGIEFMEERAGLPKEIRQPKKHLAGLSSMEQRIVVTVVKHWIEHQTRAKFATKYNQLPKTNKNEVEFSQGLLHIRPSIEVERAVQVQALPLPEFDPTDTTAKARLSRLMREMTQAKKSLAQRADADYDRLLSIFTQLPLDRQLLADRDQTRLNEVMKTIKYSLYESFKQKFLSLHPDGFQQTIALKKDPEVITNHLLDHGLPTNGLKLFHIGESEARQALRELMAKATWELLPEQIRLAIEEKEGRKYAAVLYATLEATPLNERNLDKTCLSPTERTKQVEKLVQAGIPPEEAFSAVEAMVQERDQTRKERLKQQWKNIPPSVRSMFSKEQDYYLAPLLGPLGAEFFQRKNLDAALRETLKKLNLSADHPAVKMVTEKLRAELQK